MGIGTVRNRMALRSPPSCESDLRAIFDQRAGRAHRIRPLQITPGAGPTTQLRHRGDNRGHPRPLFPPSLSPFAERVFLL